MQAEQGYIKQQVLEIIQEKFGCNAGIVQETDVLSLVEQHEQLTKDEIENLKKQNQALREVSSKSEPLIYKQEFV